MVNCRDQIFATHCMTGSAGTSQNWHPSDVIFDTMGRSWRSFHESDIAFWIKPARIKLLKSGASTCWKHFSNKIKTQQECLEYSQHSPTYTPVTSNWINILTCYGPCQVANVKPIYWDKDFGNNWVLLLCAALLTKSPVSPPDLFEVLLTISTTIWVTHHPVLHLVMRIDVNGINEDIWSWELMLMG